MRDRVDANNESRNTVENDNRIFDLVLNMNSTSKQKNAINRQGQLFSAAPGGFGGEKSALGGNIQAMNSKSPWGDI